MNSNAEDPRSLSGLIDGGNHRTIAHLIEDVPLLIKPDIRQTKLHATAKRIADIDFLDRDWFFSTKQIEHPQYYTETPTPEDIQYMQERIDSFRLKNS